MVKKTKKSEKEVDIRPLIYDWRIQPDRIFLQLAAGSEENLKPELVMEAFAGEQGEKWNPLACQIRRMELYARTDGEELVPLEELGEVIE